jgi:hypothetical protein
VIRLLGHIVAMVVILKPMWIGGLTEGYFGLYAVFIAGDASFAQMLKMQAPAEDAK